jgi:methionine synthase II (cobalamin-independent)
MGELKGLATGIGSLPYKDADVALKLIFKYCPQVPFWPQLPKRDIREGMVAQFSEGLPCIKVTDKGIFFNPEDKEKELEKFYEKIISQDLEYFKISRDFSQGLYAFQQRLSKSDLKHIEFIKCHITGPFTFAASLKDEKGVALLHDSVFMQAIIKGLSMKALWQVRFFEKFSKKLIIFVDEPYLGCFGSAYTPINKEDVVKGLTELLEPVKSQGVLLGVHCCGNTDWSIFNEVKEIGIISFDAYSYLDKFVLYADNLKDFLQRGGIICWGIVPTQEFSGRETPDLLVSRIKDAIATLSKKGVDTTLLSENLLISPACGLGTLDAAKSEKIFKLLSETSSIIRKSP